jgi:hypothetical protein
VGLPGDLAAGLAAIATSVDARAPGPFA